MQKPVSMPHKTKSCSNLLLVKALFLAAIVFFGTVQANNVLTSIYVHNKGDNDVYVAAVYRTSYSLWDTKGWWKVTPGSSGWVLIEAETHGSNLYYLSFVMTNDKGEYGHPQNMKISTNFEYDSDHLQSSNEKFCVKKDGAETNRTSSSKSELRNCPDGYHLVPFGILAIVPMFRQYGTAKMNVYIYPEKSGKVLKVNEASNTVKQERFSDNANSTDTNSLETLAFTVAAIAVIAKLFSSDDTDNVQEPVHKEPPKLGTAIPRRIADNEDSVPFVPDVDGDWIEHRNWIDWSEKLLSKKLGRNINIEILHTISLPFYSTEGRSVILAEAVQKGRLGAYYIIQILGEPIYSILDGTGLSIYEFNKELNFSLDTTAAAKQYLKFFTSNNGAKEGVFTLLEPENPLFNQRILSGIDIQPIVVTKNKSNDWVIKADFIYGENIFKGEFHIGSNGKVNLLKESFQKSITIKYRIVIDNGMRKYVK